MEFLFCSCDSLKSGFHFFLYHISRRHNVIIIVTIRQRVR
ncbi:unnamed protein product [Schistosoma margrebowiei]|uniref:Uncharacterized protein n=1 Tax=Schistosoma margrebowiei TaxID=48269 RepID=A0A3P7WIH3_9TREM|nr:unnamed protein product [Schistosoma margrebowiei]